MFKNLLSRAFRVFRIIFTVKSLKKNSSKQNKLIAQKALLNQFTDARGSIMKFGQLLASSNNQTSEALKSLVTGIPAFPLSEINEQLELALNKQVKDVFISLDESKAAASLGQVHHAVLQNHEEVAVKFQYPDMREKINTEIKLFQLMPGIGPVKKWGFDIESYKQCFKKNLDRELDYNIEATNQLHFREKIQIKGLIVPYVYQSFTKHNLLVQSWEDGVHLDKIKHWPKQDRQKIAEIILATLLKSLFEFGVIHGDPHLGNSYYRFNGNQQPEMVLMDYGCMIEVSEIQRLSLLKLILSTIEKKDVPPIRYFSAMGFDADKLSKIGDALPLMCSILFEPFIEPNLFHVKNWQLESRFNQILQERRWWFRSAGPSSLLLLMRAFQGVVQQLQMLEISISWSKVLFQHVAEEILEQARNLELPEIPQEKNINNKNINSLARYLRINVLKNGQQTANITLPSEMVLDIDTLVPIDVLEKLKSDPSIDLELLINNIRDSGIAPQKIFTLEDHDKKYSVWLE